MADVTRPTSTGDVNGLSYNGTAESIRPQNAPELRAVSMRGVLNKKREKYLTRRQMTK